MKQSPAKARTILKNSAMNVGSLSSYKTNVPSQKTRNHKLYFGCPLCVQDNVQDYYFCCVDEKGFLVKNKHLFVYHSWILAIDQCPRMHPVS